MFTFPLCHKAAGKQWHTHCCSHLQIAAIKFPFLLLGNKTIGLQTQQIIRQHIHYTEIQRCSLQHSANVQEAFLMVLHLRNTRRGWPFDLAALFIHKRARLLSVLCRTLLTSCLCDGWDDVMSPVVPYCRFQSPAQPLLTEPQSYFLRNYVRPDHDFH